MSERPGGKPLGHQRAGAIGDVDPIWVKIRETRLAQGLSLLQLSRLSNVAMSTLSRGERGYDTWLSKTRTVAKVLDIEIFTLHPSLKWDHIEAESLEGAE